MQRVQFLRIYTIFLLALSIKIECAFLFYNYAKYIFFIINSLNVTNC